MTGPEFVDPWDWESFRECYGPGNPGLRRIADCLQDAGYDFLSYGDIRWKGRQVAVLRISNFLDRYAVFRTKGKPVHLARFTDSGKMIPVRILLPKPSETLWDAVVRSIWEDSLRG